MELAFTSITPEHFRPPLLGERSYSSRQPQRQNLKKYKSRRLPTKPAKQVRRSRSSEWISDPPSAPFMDFIRRAFDSTLAKTPLPKHSGFIRFLTPSPPEIAQYDRSLTEWYEYIENYKVHMNAFPFLKESMKRVEENFFKQQRIRLLVQKCVHRMMKRMIDARPHDTCDLYTTLPIPQGQCVTVYDIGQKRKYTFHTHTAIKIIESALYYSSYGIARPLLPKNPYTNVPWTMAQMISIVHQISYNLLRRHAFLPLDIHAFRNARYCAQRFYRENPKPLNIRAARAFFAQTDDAYRNSIYREIVSDLHTDMHIRKGLIPYVMDRLLPAALMRKWDDIVVASFMEQNLHVFTDEFRTLDAINTAFLAAHDETYIYVSRHRRKVRREETATMQWNIVGASIIRLGGVAVAAEAAESGDGTAPGGEPMATGEVATGEVATGEVATGEVADENATSSDEMSDEDAALAALRAAPWAGDNAGGEPDNTNINISTSLESVWGDLSAIVPVNLTELFNQTVPQTANPASVSMLFGTEAAANIVAPIVANPYSNTVVNHLTQPSTTAVEPSTSDYINMNTIARSPVLRYSNIGTEISIISHESDSTLETMILNSINSFYEF